MNALENKIWYASYGSNMQMERFLCYIRGGQPKGRQDLYPGCRDKTLPTFNEELYITSRLYFARESKGWNNGGVAFLSTSFDDAARTLARMYLITQGQLIDIIKQEIKFKGELTIDFDECMRLGSWNVKDPSWYGNLIYLEKHNQSPVYTFTSSRDFSGQINRPDDSYLKTIIEGIKETFPVFNEFDICDYLLPLEGIHGNFSREALISLITQEHI